MNDERNKFLTFRSVECAGNQRVFTNREGNGQELPPPKQRTARTSELNSSGGARKKGIDGWGCFVPVGATNQDQRPHICPD